MEAVREKWTDERLDDLKEQVVTGFERVDGDIREVRSEVAGLRTEMSDRFDATHRLIVQVGAGLFGTMAMGFLGMIATLLLTQS
ncbi:MAG TPA: hypothetical protein VFI17_12515 [Solirubrobacterales bacterium]|nr:hypothetical protein [Solirubrobacterales bacterium]